MSNENFLFCLSALALLLASFAVYYSYKYYRTTKNSYFELRIIKAGSLNEMFKIGEQMKKERACDTPLLKLFHEKLTQIRNENVAKANGLSRN